jgi:hypothetical protein
MNPQTMNTINSIGNIPLTPAFDQERQSYFSKKVLNCSFSLPTPTIVIEFALLLPPSNGAPAQRRRMRGQLNLNDYLQSSKQGSSCIYIDVLEQQPPPTNMSIFPDDDSPIVAQMYLQFQVVNANQKDYVLSDLLLQVEFTEISRIKNHIAPP